MVVAHNLYAENAQRQFALTQMNKKKATEKLSSGYRINRAADDAAGLAISEKMRKQIRGLNRGTKNLGDGVSWVQIGDGAMAEVHDILQRMTELSVHGANGTLSPSDRQAIDAEMQQLKVEINRINETTKFNDKRIFTNDMRPLDDSGEFMLRGVAGFPADFKIFNADYDHETGKATYGGIVFHGERVSWDAIDSNMVYMDNGTQKFHEGFWEYTDAQNRKFTISAKEGDTVPDITRFFSVMADMDGLHVDDTLIEWKNVKNRYGECIEDTQYLNETWYVDYMGATISFQIKDAFAGLSGLFGSVSAVGGESRYNMYSTYSGSRDVQAMNADIRGDNLKIRTTGYTICADEDGVWLRDNRNQADVAGSKRSWSELGINSWNGSGDINSAFVYRYADTDGVNDTDIAFNFTLSDITSKQSVIDGLDEVEIVFQNIRTNYSTLLTRDPSKSKVVQAQLTQNTRVSIEDEFALNRNFDQMTQSFVGDLSYDRTKQQISLVYESGGTAVITYKGSTTGVANKMNADLSQYADSVVAAKREQLLNGTPGTLDFGERLSNYTLSLASASNGAQTIGYTYNYADYADQIRVSMRADAAGGYVERIGGGYERYDSSNAAHMGVPRYQMEVSGTDASTRENYVENAVRYMVEATSVTLRANDFTYANYRGNQNRSTAAASIFQSYSISANQPTRYPIIKGEDSIQILKSGEASNHLIIPRFSVNTAALGLNRAQCVTQDSCRNTIDMVNRALEHISARRSLYGALQNRMEHAIRSNENTEENTTAAESRIRDTDMAEEVVNYSKSNILEQAGQAMIAQANQRGQDVLSLLQ